MATAATVLQELLAAIETEGPAVLGTVLTSVAPTLPVGVLVELATLVAALVQQAQANSLTNEKTQLHDAVQAADVATDAAEVAAGAK